MLCHAIGTAPPAQSASPHPAACRSWRHRRRVLDELFELFENGDAHEKIEEIITRSLVVKKNIVERDEREGGPRAALNFGHTLGHAVESFEGLGGLYHGECVALGMLPMIDDSALRQRLRAVCKKLGLPARIDYDGDRVLDYIRRDKKAGGEGVKTVRVREAGQYYFEYATFDELRALAKEGIR